jgi:hypothetical protein
VAARLRSVLEPLVASRAFRERGIYDLVAVSRLLARPPCGDDTDALLLLAQMELWHQSLDAQVTPG